MTKFKLKTVTKINLKITVKCHAHLQTFTKTPVKFQKDPDKIVGGIVFTILDTICDGQLDGWTVRRTHGEKQYTPDPDGGRHNKGLHPRKGSYTIQSLILK